MRVSPELRNQIMTQAQGALALYAAFVGVANPLFATLVKIEKSTPEELAKQTGLDPGYVSRWCDAAFAFGYLEEVDSQLRVTELGRAFLPETPGTVARSRIGRLCGEYHPSNATGAPRGIR